MVGNEKTRTLERPIRERDPLTKEEKELVARAIGFKLTNETQGQLLSVNHAQSLGASDSAHDVFFVQPANRNPSNKRIVYGCKRFRRLESAQHELSSIIAAKEMNFATLQPAGEGIYTFDSLGHFLVTRHIPRLVTMNHLGWRDFYVGQPNYDRRAAAPLKRIGKFAAKMHNAGIIHNDFQLKNAGQNQKGEFVLFDMEDAAFWNPDSVNSSDFISYVGEELFTLTRSLVDKGFLWNSTDNVFREEVSSNLMDSYLEDTVISDTSLLDLMHRNIEDALLDRTRLHTSFANRMGLPS